MARMDTKGIDAKIAPIKELRLEISEINSINNIVITIFTM
jgi:hypothetical protein